MEHWRAELGRRAPGPRPPGWLVEAPFAAEAGRIVDALAHMRLSVSIFVLRFEGLSASRACALAEDALGEEGLVGRLPDRSVGLLRIADEAPEPDALRARLMARLAARLARLEPAARSVRVHVAERHDWTDRLAGAAETVEQLMDAPVLTLPLERPWRS